MWSLVYARSVRDRQHRQPRLRVLLGAVQRQRPEMRRRPDENDQEQQQRFRRDVVGHRGPAEHRRHRARRAADDDILRRGGLEQHRVDDRVADERRQRQPHRQRIDHHVQYRETRGADDAGEHQRLGRGQVAARQRSRAGARHHGVDLLLDQAVDRRRRAGDQRDAQRAEHQRVERRQRRRGEKHADHRREHDQRDDARLGQRQELAQAVVAKRDGGHRTGRQRAGQGINFTIAAHPICDALRTRCRSLASPRMSGSAP